eukprot:706270-Prymnesium_polylepis.1
MVSCELTKGSSTAVFATTPPAAQNGSMKSTGPTPPPAKVAGTTAENHATLNAPPKSDSVPRPLAGTSTRRLPASERETRARLAIGLLAPLERCSFSRASSAAAIAASASASLRA